MSLIDTPLTKSLASYLDVTAIAKAWSRRTSPISTRPVSTHAINFRAGQGIGVSRRATGAAHRRGPGIPTDVPTASTVSLDREGLLLVQTQLQFTDRRRPPRSQPPGSRWRSRRTKDHEPVRNDGGQRLRAGTRWSRGRAEVVTSNLANAESTRRPRRRSLSETRKVSLAPSARHLRCRWVSAGAATQDAGSAGARVRAVVNDPALRW